MRLGVLRNEADVHGILVVGLVLEAAVLHLVSVVDMYTQFFIALLRHGAIAILRLRGDEPRVGIHDVPHDQLEVVVVGVLPDNPLVIENLLLQHKPEPIQVADVLDLVVEPLHECHQLRAHDEGGVLGH